MRPSGPEPSPPREQAVHERRNWVRLSYACNNRCAFCLDAATHDGELRPHEEIVEQVVRGRQAGASRLILSGGEPTLHPSFIELVRLGVELGYRRVQTVTNGRRFAYPAFLKAALDAGLGEITFSIHGPDAATHDELVGVRGAFAQTIAGLRRALADGRAVVNVDVVLNRTNVPLLRATLGGLMRLGVREFELLWAVPFGRAYAEGRSLLLDVDCAAALGSALDLAAAHGATVWLSRVPPEVLDGHEELIPDPHKLFDEVRGRLPELERLVRDGVDLDCHEPARCARCAIGAWREALDRLWTMLDTGGFDVVRIEATEDAPRAVPFGVDPASARRAASAPGERAHRSPLAPLVLAELMERSEATAIWLVAADIAQARSALTQLPRLPGLELELANASSIAGALQPGSTDAPRAMLDGRRVDRIVSRRLEDLDELLALPFDFELVVPLSRRAADWLLAEPRTDPRLRLMMPVHERASAAVEHDVDLAWLFERVGSGLPVEGVPRCLSGRAPSPRPRVLDWAAMGDDGRIDLFRFTHRYVDSGPWSKASACGGCPDEVDCPGLPTQHRRALLTRPFPPLAWRRR